MGAFADHPVIEYGKGLAEEHWGEEKVKEHTGKYASVDDGVTGVINGFSNGNKAADAFDKGEYLSGTKYATKAAADGSKVATALGGNKDGFGVVGSTMKMASNGASMIDHIQKGEGMEALKDGTSGVGNAFTIGEKIAKLRGNTAGAESMKGNAGIASGVANTYEAINLFEKAGHESKEEKEKDDYIYGQGYVDSFSKGAEAVNDFSDSFGPQGKAIGAGAKGLKFGLELGSSGNKFAKRHDLHGQNRDGTNRSISDVVTDEGSDMHDLVHSYLGEGTGSDILSHMAGAGKMLTALPGAGLEAAGLGVAGFAEDIYKSGKGAVSTASDYAAKLWHGLF